MRAQRQFKFELLLFHEPTNQPGNDDRIALSRPVNPLSPSSLRGGEARNSQETEKRLTTTGTHERLRKFDSRFTTQSSKLSVFSALSEEEKREPKREINRKNRQKKKTSSGMNQGGRGSPQGVQPPATPNAGLSPISPSTTNASTTEATQLITMDVQ